MPRLQHGRRLLERIGGPNSVSWPGFLILLLIGSLVSLAAGSSPPSGGPWIGVVVSVLGAVVVYGVLILARATVLRSVAKRARPWRTLLCFGIATAFGIVAASMVGGILAMATGASHGSTAPQAAVVVMLSIVGTLVGAVLILALAAVVVDAWREYRDLAEGIRELDRQLDQVESTTVAELEEQDERIRAEVESLLLSEIQALGSGDTSEAASRLRRAALDVLRPLSHDLGIAAYGVQRMEQREPAFDASELVRDATATRLFSPWVSAVIIAVPVMFSVLVAEPGTGALWVAAITCAEVGILAWIANAIYARRADLASVPERLAWLITSTLAIGACVLVTWLGLNTVERLGIAWGVLAWIVPVILLLPAVLGALRGARERQQRTLGELRDDVDWQLARSRELVWARQTTLARALHGPIQSGVLAASIRLDTAARAGEISQAVVGEARSALMAALVAFTASPDEVVDLAETFARVREMWAGVATITLEAEPGMIDVLARDPVCSRAVADVLTEGCSNAVRHGKATSIAIRLRFEGTTRVCVVVSDDGHARAIEGEGMGSRLLDTVAISWNRTSTAEGTQLSVLLPVMLTVG